MCLVYIVFVNSSGQTFKSERILQVFFRKNDIYWIIFDNQQNSIAKNMFSTLQSYSIWGVQLEGVHYLTELFHVGIQVEGVHADGGQPGDTLQHFVGGGPALSAPKHIICSGVYTIFK